VSHAGQCFNRLVQQVVAGLPLHMGHQTEATVILEFSEAIKTFVHKPTSLKSFKNKQLQKLLSPEAKVAGKKGKQFYPSASRRTIFIQLQRQVLTVKKAPFGALFDANLLIFQNKKITVFSEKIYCFF
jgi:hypothetical protein